MSPFPASVEGAGGLLLDAACHVRVRVYRHGRAHDLERVTVAAIVRIGASEHLQRFDLGRIAAPGRRQCLELRDGIAALDIVARLPQHDLAQPPLRGGSAIPRVGRDLVEATGILHPAKPLVEATVEERHHGLDLLRDADRFELVELSRRAGDVAHLDISADHLLHDVALQLERQRPDRGFHGAEALARLRPLAELGIG